MKVKWGIPYENPIMEIRRRTATIKVVTKNEIYGYWDGGGKTIFEWDVEDFKSKKPCRFTNKNGDYIEVGSWAANSWFRFPCKGDFDKNVASAARRVKNKFKQYEIAKFSIIKTYEFAY